MKKVADQSLKHSNEDENSISTSIITATTLAGFIIANFLCCIILLLIYMAW